MRAETSKDKGALDAYDGESSGYDWEWPAVFILIGLAALWIWRTHLKNQKQKLKSEELVRKSLSNRNDP